MMNIKYYLRGLGIGLIITTLILTISHHISNPNVDKNNSDSTQPQTTTGSVIAYDKENKTDNKEQTSAPTETQPMESSDETEVTIDLSGIYYGSDAAELLYEAGVIEDPYEFSDYLKENGYDTMVREGVYTFKKGDTFENLARIIMKT